MFGNARDGFQTEEKYTIATIVDTISDINLSLLKGKYIQTGNMTT